MLVFFPRVQKISKNSSAKYYKKKQENAWYFKLLGYSFHLYFTSYGEFIIQMYQDLTEDLSCDMCQELSEEDKKTKSNNMVTNDMKVSQKMKNKG